MRKKDIFWGLIFILAAVFVVLNQFGYIKGIGLFDIAVTVILAGILIKNILQLNFYGIFFPVALILIIYDEQLKITKFTPWPALLTALLLSIGFSLIFKHPRKHHIVFYNDLNHDPEIEDKNTVYCSTLFGDCIKYVNSSDFKNASIKTTFGDVKIYFDKALVPSKRAEIYLNVNFGDVNLYLPRNWKILNDTHNFLGDMNISDGYEYNESSVEISLTGNIFFGNVNIIYVD